MTFRIEDTLHQIKLVAKNRDPTPPQCLKITQNVAFNIASEASYVYFLNGQKFIKSAKNGRFWRVFENLEQWYQTGGKCQNSDETFCVIFNNV